MTKLNRLRTYIKQRTAELGIGTDHSDEGHFYTTPKTERFPSVTGKLKVVPSKGVMEWKMNRALEWIRENNILETPLETFLKLAAAAPDQAYAELASIGNAVHQWRELWFCNWIDTSEPDVPSVIDPRPEVIAACGAIARCMVDTGALPIACELRLTSSRLGIGGTLDDLWLVPVRQADQSIVWETWLVDLKTSASVDNKLSFYLQVSTYWSMFKKLYPKVKIDKCFILHVSKEMHGQYKLVPIKNPKRYSQIAETAFRFSAELEELAEDKRPVITRI